MAYELAAAGVGQLVLAHAGNIKHSDLNSPVANDTRCMGTSRVESARARLLELNPRLDIVTVPENVSESNASELVQQVDIVVDCAPLFEERFALNREIVRQRKPMVECAMYDLEAHITTIVPGTTPCLNCPLSQETASLASAVPRVWSRFRYGWLHGSHGSRQTGRRIWQAPHGVDDDLRPSRNDFSAAPPANANSIVRRVPRSITNK